MAIAGFWKGTGREFSFWLSADGNRQQLSACSYCEEPNLLQILTLTLTLTLILTPIPNPTQLNFSAVFVILFLCSPSAQLCA